MNRPKAWLVAIALLGSAQAAHAEKKVTVCHVPPGNPAQPHTISIGEAAVSAHLAHGDQAGACASGCPASCDDANLCTSDSCGANGQCLHVAVSCDDGNPCTLDACDPAVGCLRLPDDGQSCDDGNACTGGDTCTATQCHGNAIAGCCVTGADCDDANPCTDDSCGPGGCQNVPRDCAVLDKCLAGFCNANSSGACETTPVSCDDSNVCTDDSCDPTFGCTHSPTLSPPEPSEASCADGADNDCDGAVDGADPDCYACFNGILEPGEECDDGNTNPFDGCDQCHLVDINPD
jgi:cysteine-rich repeat protein